MSEASSRILYIFLDIVLPLAVGYALKQRRLMSPAQCNFLIRFNIICIMSVLALLSMWVLPLKPDLLSLPFFAFFNAFFPLAIIFLLHRQRRFTDKIDKGSYLISAMPSNAASLGGLCGYLLYGEIAFAYAQLLGVFQNLVMFFVLFPMAYYYHNSGQSANIPAFLKSNWKNIFINWNQLSIVAIIAGILLYISGVPRPAVLGQFFQGLVHVNAWAALLPVGYLIEFSHLKVYCKPTLDLIPIKMILTPAVSYILAVQFTSDPVLLGALLIMMATPCAINALITTRLYDLNVNLSMAPFITTTILYILILYPAFYLLVSLGYLPFK